MQISLTHANMCVWLCANVQLFQIALRLLPPSIFRYTSNYFPSIVAALFAGTYSAYIHTFVYICIYYCICTTDFDFMLRSLGSASASAVLFAVLSTVNCQMSAVSYAKITMKQDTKEEKKKQNKNLIKKQGKHTTHNKNWGKAFQKT